jgi:AraC-like DNA-binding protein
MRFDFKPDGDVGLMAVLSKVFGGEIENGMLILPKTFGEGYIKEYNLGPFLKMMIHQYELAEDVMLKRVAAQEGKGTITFSFRNAVSQANEKKDNSLVSAQNSKLLPSVQVSSGDVDLDFFYPAKTKINAIIIATQVNLLRSLMSQQENSPFLQTILSGNRPYLYEEIISPEIQKVAAEIVAASVPEQLRDFYFKIKAQELICLFFIELIKRDHVDSYPLKVSEVRIIYQVRDRIISDLSVVPNLPELARFSAMSESKMKRLFKQIFGNSIYNYYQTFRMNEAAYLIKEQKFSISETGLRLGFTNLSHFTRIFEKHIGHKPKKYSTFWT